MTLYFDNGHEPRRPIGHPSTKKSAYQLVYKFLEEHNYKAPYTREWTNDINETQIDVGSHTEFFIWC